MINKTRILTLVMGLTSMLMLGACGSSSTAIQPLGAASGTAMGSTPSKYVAGTVSPGKTEIPTHIVNAVTGHLTAELKKRGLDAVDAQDAIRIDATTTYYRMRSGFSRMMVGILAGKDGIEADVKLVDAKTNQAVGEFKVKSYNMTAVGGEDDVARMLAEEIAKALEAYKR